MATTDAVLEAIEELKKLVREQNGRLRLIELWQARAEGMGMLGKGLSGLFCTMISAVVAALVVILAGWMRDG